MSELSEAQKELSTILDKIPASGSFEGARLAQQASKLAQQIVHLCSHPDAKIEIEKALTTSPEKKP